MKHVRWYNNELLVVNLHIERINESLACDPVGKVDVVEETIDAMSYQSGQRSTSDKTVNRASRGM